jgi:hypothetical protein
MRRPRPVWGCSGTEKLKSAVLGSCYWWTCTSGVRAARTSVGGEEATSVPVLPAFDYN